MEIIIISSFYYHNPWLVGLLMVQSVLSRFYNLKSPGLTSSRSRLEETRACSIDSPNGWQTANIRKNVATVYVLLKQIK